MTDFEKKLESFYELCTTTHKSFSAVDMGNQMRLARELQKETIKIYKDLEIIVNVMTIKDMSREISDRKNVDKLLYIILKSLSMLSQKGNYSFEIDGRSEDSAKLAKIVMQTYHFDKNFGQMHSWYRNELLFDKIFSDGLLRAGVHKTLLQNMVRALIMTLERKDYKCQPIPKYMLNFENCVLTVLRTNHINLSFV